MTKLGSRLVLVPTAVGLALILVSVVVYRFTGPPLVRQIGPQAAPQSMGQPKVQMPPEGMGGNEQAVIDAMQLLQQNPNDVTVLLKLSEIFRQQDNYESAQNFITRAMVASPSDPRPSYVQGVLLADQGDYKGAVAAMERSLGLADSPATRYSLAKIYIYNLQQPDKGRIHLEAAHAMPNLPDELHHLIDEEMNK